MLDCGYNVAYSVAIMKTTRRLHLEIQKHRAQAYGLIRSSYREGGQVKHTAHGRITGMSVSQLKLLQAAFRGEVVPKESPQSLQLLGSALPGLACEKPLDVVDCAA